MDFRRIEGIFLAVFIALDIFLGWSMTQNRRVYQNSAGRNGNAQVAQQIHRDDIALPKLSNKASQGNYVAAQTNTLLSQKSATIAASGNLSVVVTSSEGYQVLTAKLNSPLRLRKKNVAAQLAAYVADPNNVLYGDRYEYSAGSGGKDTYVFHERLDKRLVLDERATLTLTVEDGMLVSYQQSYIEAVTPMDNTQHLISQKDAVYTLYQSNEIMDSSRVIWIKCGYTWLLSTRGSQVFTPAWFVGIESKNSKNVTVKRVNAVTQAVMKSHN